MTPDVQTEPAKRPEQYSSGKPRVKMAKEEDDSPPGSPTDMPVEKKKGCFVCGGLERGDTWVSLPDENNIGRVIHTPITAIGNKSVDKNLDCLETFTTRVATAQRQQVREQQEDLALAAHSRQFPAPQPRGFNCPAPDCSRFFDSENGRDLHMRKGHKVG